MSEMIATQRETLDLHHCLKDLILILKDNFFFQTSKHFNNDFIVDFLGINH
jgi:hypothetical protein